MDVPDRERWKQLSPLLDELLDLDAPARATRLAQLRGADRALADELEALLGAAGRAEAANITKVSVTRCPVRSADSALYRAGPSRCLLEELRMNLTDPTFVPRRTARHFVPGGIGAVVLAATLASALYVINTAHGSQALDTLPPTAAVDRSAAAPSDADATTFHAGVDLSAVPAEPDPSPRAIAAYGSP